MIVDWARTERLASNNNKPSEQLLLSIPRYILSRVWKKQDSARNWNRPARTASKRAAGIDH